MSRLLLLLAAVVTLGCSSMRSTMLYRSESNTHWEKERRLKGVPITVKVPTHMKVTVFENQYLLDKPGAVQFVELDVPVRSVTTELIKTDKIFTIDPKTPGSGTAGVNMTFKSQYPNSIAYRIEDDTLDAIASLLSKNKGAFGISTSEQDPGKFADLKPIPAVVATTILELDAPDLELQLAEFLRTHLNGCHTCEITPPGVEMPRQMPRME